ncbi:hypothetical protein AB0H37_31535 [Actinomadura sp. NPDC023710]|uniref:hypothetical protein n=1 Tax=Actinomadura sp. NPDC023710 TaxID=3158219 RepID=UPI0033CB7034
MTTILHPGTVAEWLRLKDVKGIGEEEVERKALHLARQFFGPDAVLLVAGNNWSETLGGTETVYVRASFPMSPQVDERTGTPVELMLNDLTGNSMRQLERKAAHLARQCFGPETAFQIVFTNGLESDPPEHLGTTDRYWTTSVSVRAIVPASPQVKTRTGTPVRLTLKDLTGNSMRQVKRDALHLARQCFGPDAVLQVGFDHPWGWATRGLENNPPERLGTTDRFWAESVYVLAIVPTSPRVGERTGTPVRLTLNDITGNSMRQVERNAVHLARQRRPHTAPGTVFRVNWNSMIGGLEGISRTRPSARPRFLARHMEVEVI